MPGCDGELGEGIPGTILRRVTGIRNRQQRDIYGEKGTGFIEPRHRDCSFSDDCKIADANTSDHTAINPGKALRS